MHTKKSKKEKKRLFLISITIIGLLSLLVATVYNDWKEILNNRKLESELTKQYSELLDEETKLSAEITKLQDDTYLARYAKEKYMLSSEGDTIIKWDQKKDWGPFKMWKYYYDFPSLIILKLNFLDLFYKLKANQGQYDILDNFLNICYFPKNGQNIYFLVVYHLLSISKHNLVYLNLFPVYRLFLDLF